MARPLKFKTAKELQAKIDEYFAKCDAHTKTVYNQKTGELDVIPHPKPYTVEGLAAALEVDRHTLNNYEDRDEFFTTIKKAKLKILSNLQERALMGDNVASITIFNLKNNYGYTDKQEIEHSTGEDLDIKINILSTQPLETDEPNDDE